MDLLFYQELRFDNKISDLECEEEREKEKMNIAKDRKVIPDPISVSCGDTSSFSSFIFCFLNS